ncbi:unnamed protein product [Symbiodinium necroappetens]|uniref:Uncharacterized protein n=1 Tax=Symbiodinium necroappetens TaxID=1628268 RepID=A0A813ADL2_9DINO|nr:unnamed protein product [Symbiodinium necroappetens]
MATRLVGASASTVPARVARMTTATTPTQPSASESQDRAPTPSWEEVGPRTSPPEKARAVRTARPSSPLGCGSAPARPPSRHKTWPSPGTSPPSPTATRRSSSKSAARLWRRPSA